MNKFVKAVIATGLLAAVGTPAMAAIDIGDNGELLLTLTDATAQRSLALGLGSNLNNVTPTALAGQSGTVLSFDVSAQVNALLGAGATLGNLVYSVSAIDGVPVPGTQTRFGRAYAVTGQVGAETQSMSNNALQTATNVAGQYAAAVNAGNGDGVVADPASTYYGLQPTWGETLGGSFAAPSGKFGDALGFYYYASSTAYAPGETAVTYSSKQVVTKEVYQLDGLYGKWLLAGSNGSYTLTYTQDSLPPSEVPLPAAAWLLLSGLTGLGVIGRRRRDQAAA